jgi:hypothetical protein
MIKCSDCRNQAADGRARCDSCLQKVRDADRRKRTERVANGKCPRCGGDRRFELKYCDSCLEKYAEHRKATVARKRARGLCLYCSELAVTGKTMCASHALKLTRAASSRLKTDRVKINARVRVQGAVREGRIVRPSNCSQCGIETIPQGHHDDYGKPLDVRWLCVDCHAAYHASERRSSIAKAIP